MQNRGAPPVGEGSMNGAVSHNLLTTLAESAPKFAPRKGVLMREYHVLVTWPDGRRMKIGQFPRKPDATRWIQQKSADWLAHYLETNPVSLDESNLGHLGPTAR